MALLTLRQYADYRRKKNYPGQTLDGVKRAITSGRISVRDDGLIDTDIADIEWEQNTSKTRGNPWGVGVQPRHVSDVITDAEEVKKFASPTVSVLSTAAQDINRPFAPNLNEEKAKREFYEAELARLKVEEKKGQLIDILKVKNFLFGCGRIVRAGHEQAVAQISPLLVNKSSIIEIERTLKKTFEELDERLAAQIEKTDELTSEED